MTIKRKCITCQITKSIICKHYYNNNGVLDCKIGLRTGKAMREKNCSGFEPVDTV